MSNIFVILLVVYAFVTVPLVTAAFVRIYRRGKQRAAEKPIGDDMERRITKRLDILLKEMVTQNTIHDFWSEQDHRDLTALLTSTRTIATALINIKDSVNDNLVKGVSKPPEYYIAQLQFARDKYAKTPSQKKVLDSIISSIIPHGTTNKA